MTKKIILLMTILALFSACQSLIEDIRIDKSKPMPVLTAQILQDHDTHRISVYNSSGADCSESLTAQVRCRVNDGPEFEVPWTDYSGFLFNYRFIPGDKLTVTARLGNQTASASAIVPACQGSIVKVDTMSLNILVEDDDIIAYVDPDGNQVHSYTYTEQHYDIQVQDFPDEQETHYFLFQMEDVVYTIDSSGRATDSLFSSHHFVNSGDALLHPGGNSLFGEIGLSENVFSLFTNVSFASSTHTFRLEDENYDDALWAVLRSGSLEVGDSARLECRIKLYTLTQDEYTYLNCISSEQGGFYISGLSEPIVYPSNVKGGLGFVSIVTPAIYTLRYPTIAYSEDMRVIYYDSE